MHDDREDGGPTLRVVEAERDTFGERVARFPESNLFAGDAAGFSAWLREQADRIDADHNPTDRIKFAGVLETTCGVFPTMYNTNPLDRMAFGVLLQQDGIDSMRG